MEKDKETLIKNQYQTSFFEQIVKDILEKIIQPEPEDDSENNASSVTQSDSSVTQSDISGGSDMHTEYSES